MRFIFPLMFICYLLGNIYLFISTIKAIAQAPIAVKVIYGIIFWSLSVSLFASIALRNSHLPQALLGAMYTLGSVWLVFILYMILSIILFSIVRYFFPSIIHNTLLYSFIVTLALLVYGYINHLTPKVTTIEIETEKAIEGDSVTIVGISDVHLGHGTGSKRLHKFVDIINKQNPDAVIIAGDLIDNSVHPLYNKEINNELKRIEAAMGIYMAPGNHEYISGITECTNIIKSTPVNMLVDETATLPNGMQIICRDDASNRRRQPLDKLLSGADNSRLTLLIDHQPREIAEKDSARIDIQFSGHTHNGQIWPGSIITSKLFEQANGYRKWKHSHVYVSSGISLWGPPLRIGTNNEIVVFKIRSNKK